MSPTPDLDSAVILGEMRGQLRELVHSSNNNSMKIDGLAREMAAANVLLNQVTALSERITALEADRNRRDGALGLGGWLMKTPVIQWILMIALTAWVVIKGKVA